jgi:hypothetical protein
MSPSSSTAMVPVERVGAIATDFSWAPTSAETPALRKIMRASVLGDGVGKQNLTELHAIPAFDSQLPKVRLPRIKGDKKSRDTTALVAAPRYGLHSAGDDSGVAIVPHRPQSPASPTLYSGSGGDGGGGNRSASAGATRRLLTTALGPAPLDPSIRRDFYLPETMHFLDFLKKHRISRFASEFEHWFYSDEVLARIVAWNPDTTELVVRNGREHVSEAAVSALAALGKLEVLSIPDCRGFTEASIKAIIKRVPNLSRLNLSGCELVDDGALAVLALKARQLQHLSLRGCRLITDMGFKTLGERPPAYKPLLELDLSGCTGLTDKGLLALLRGTRHLVKLSLAGLTGLSDLGMMGFTSAMGSGTNPGLESLDLSGTRLDAAGFAWIAPGVPALKELLLDDCPRVGRQVLELIGEHVHGLVTLSVANCPGVVDAAVAALGPQPELDKLVLTNCVELTDAAFDALALNAPRLRYLTTAGLNRVSDGALIALGAKTRLE